jgi:hypothetical protein
VGVYASLNIVVDTNESPTWSIGDGELPPGMEMVAPEGSHVAILRGTPTASGVYDVMLTVTVPSGSTASHWYRIPCMAITTTALPAFRVGVPYSYQLTCTGNVEDAAWKIISGSLPPGLILSIDGLITGTPTTATESTVRFEVIDTYCETIDRSFYTPRVALSTISSHTVATVLGWPEITTPSTPPRKYKRLTWTGTSEQWAVTWGTGESCGRASYTYNGYSEIDSAGVLLNQYTKLYARACPTSSKTPSIQKAFSLLPGTNGIPLKFKGYCWPADPESCPTCSDPPQVVGNVASNTTYDLSDFIAVPSQVTTTKTPTTIAVTSPGTGWWVALEPSQVINFPSSYFGADLGKWIFLEATHDYSATLSDEYTDAEALANALVYTSNSRAASNLPRTTGFVSTYSTVQYRLLFENLLPGQTYIAKVNFVSDTGVVTVQEHEFEADDTEELIVGNVPYPTAGHTMEVRNPTVAYAT